MDVVPATMASGPRHPAARMNTATAEERRSIRAPRKSYEHVLLDLPRPHRDRKRMHFQPRGGGRESGSGGSRGCRGRGGRGSCSHERRPLWHNATGRQSAGGSRQGRDGVEGGGQRPGGHLSRPLGVVVGGHKGGRSLGGRAHIARGILTTSLWASACVSRWTMQRPSKTTFHQFPPRAVRDRDC